MATEEDETTVNESYAVTIPATVREDLDLEPGDRLRWDVDEDGRLVAEIVRERHGAFSDLEPIDIGEETDAVEATESYEWS
ncbi:AbrB family transcriptional regulator [Halobacteriales archaeon QS_4_70_19]|jgi:antitoxin PrlF|nr:MAG: AbrB family transcriptional regulator [Halobacteriales archaeon QS_4_70_19]